MVEREKCQLSQILEEEEGSQQKAAGKTHNSNSNHGYSSYM